MKKWRLILFFLLCGFASSFETNAQCSICTKTAMQMGEKPAQGMNQGVIYLMLTPFAVAGFITYRWWTSEKQAQKD